MPGNTYSKRKAFKHIQGVLHQAEVNTLVNLAKLPRYEADEVESASSVRYLVLCGSINN